MREKGEAVRILSEGRKGGGRFLIQTESVYCWFENFEEFEKSEKSEQFETFGRLIIGPRHLIDLI